MSAPTIVVNFGEAAESSNALVVVELDTQLNGADKTSFNPGDDIFFLIHHDSSLRIVDIRSTSGDVAVQGTVRRTHTSEMLFESTDHEVELTHNPSGSVSGSWYGRSANLTVDGRTVTASAAPCIGDISYQFAATLCRLSTPTVTLGEDDEYPVAVVIYMDIV